jgi:hypothetical protein
MKNNDFTTSILVKQSPEEVFQTILNVRSWWSGLYNESFEGKSEKIGDEFSFRAGEGMHFTKQKLVEVIPNKKVTWLVTESNLSFVDKVDEWTGTRLTFDISKEGEKTKIVFTHIGLVPQFQCYDSCAPAWTQYIQEQLTKALSEKQSAKA